MDLSSREEGQGLAEYGWTIILIGILVIIILGVLGLIIANHWQQIVDTWNNIWSQF